MEHSESAKKLLSYLRSDIRHDHAVLPRPFIIEIGGTPSSGKTTLITGLDTHFKDLGFRVWCPQENAQHVRHVSRSTALYQLTTALYSMNTLLRVSAGNAYDIVFIDRGVFDACCWTRWRAEKQQLTEKERVTWQDFFLSRFFVDNVDLAYFVLCDPMVAIQREFPDAVSGNERKGRTTTPEVIGSLITIYNNTYQEISGTSPQLKILDTTLLTKKEVLGKVSGGILETLVKKIG